MAIEITAGKFAGLIRGMPEAVRDGMIRGLQSAAARGVTQVVEELEKADAVDTGGLRQSVHTEMLDDGALVVADAPHAPMIEFGTRPFWAPLEPLVLWAKRKFGVDQEEAEEIANNVRISIAFCGIRPRYFFGKAFRVIKSEFVPEEVARELGVPLGTLKKRIGKKK